MKPKRLLSLLLSLAMMMSLLSIDAFAADGAAYKDGTYTGTGTTASDGVNYDDYDVSVSVTVADSKITSVVFTDETDKSLDSSNYDYAYNALEGTRRATGVADQVIAKNGTAGVNAVSGATYSSKAIIAAVDDALSKAVDTPTVTVDKAALETAIAEAEKLTQGNYTEETWTAFQTALANAKSVDADTSATQEAVDAAKTALTDAQSKLAEKPVEPVAKSGYVLMNIPYDEFYAEETANNSVKVDVFTSATKNKVRTGSLAGGSYHKDSTGDSILGITYPVYVEDLSVLDGKNQVTDESSVTITVTNRGQTSETTYKGKDALFEADSYSYYVLAETPANYKVLTVAEDGSFTFGAVQGEKKTLTGITAELTTETTYGDYQLDLNESLKTAIDNATVNAVVVTTTDGTGYGLRHLENIWRTTELAWCTGFTDKVHNCPTSSAHYESMMGKTIDSVTYYTSTGVYVVDLEDIKVPVTVADASVTVEDGTAGDGSVDVTISLPTDFTAQYTVNGMKNFTVENGKLSFKDAAAGAYTLTVSDASGKYAFIKSNSFVLTTDQAYAKYNEDNSAPALVAADGIDADHFAAYLSNITSVSVNGTAYSTSGRGSVKIIKDDGTVDTAAQSNKTNIFDGAGEYTIEVTATGYPTLTFVYQKGESEYTYLYAALTWAEYWAGEDVEAKDNTSSNSTVDSRKEYDKGGYDAVTRATTNHGLHRGSYQCTTVIETTGGKSLYISHWSADGKTLYLTDGTSVGYSKGTITYSDGTADKLSDYKILGTKYVPVKVATADLEAFCEKYSVVRNGGTLVGGYGENKLSAYTYTAAVTANTNNLKTATKNADGSFSFSAGVTGSGSGLTVAQKTAEGIEPAVRSGDDVGSFGEFLRVDLNGNYGGLGAAMQSVTWTYYGNDSTYTKAVASYGTKFAADNWMHKSMGIQLGLTDSYRCQLPSGYDGTGYWSITVKALGYKDYTYQFQTTADNIATAQPASEKNLSSLKALVEQAEALTENLYTAETWKNLVTELGESKEMLEDSTVLNAAVKEQITHLTEAINSLKGASGYVLMNIPYADFYAAETTNNTVPVDVFTSATKNKSRTNSTVMAAGSYHVNADGSDITGITYPVYVADLSKLEGQNQVTDDSSVTITVTNRGKTSTDTYTGKAALFEAASYSYYVLGADEQANYKVLTVAEDGTFTFGAVQGDKKTLTGITGELTTETTYGDYQLNLDESLKTAIKGDGDTDATVYAVVVTTTDGTGYGMRHLENMWKSIELAWCTGFTKSVHNCPTSSAHYESMMGKTIESVTYYTSTGVYVAKLAESIYVPVTSSASVSVENGAAGTGSVAVTFTNLPQDFEPVYTVEGLDITVENGKLSYTDAELGAYTLTVTDKNGVYAPLSASFVLSTDQAYGKFNGSNEAPAVVAADGITDEQFAGYLKAVSSVSVNGTKYNASGRGSVKILNEDGTINLEALSNNEKIFGADGEYAIVVSATGYPDLTFTFTLGSKTDDGKKDDTKTDDTKKDDTKKDDGNSATSKTDDTNSTGKTTTNTQKGVKTGDTSMVLLASGLLIVCGIACIMLILFRRKKS